MADSIVRSCIECGAALVKKPGPGRWPKRCITCRPAVVRKSQPPLQLVCDHCDETFTVHVGPGPRHRKFCSPACRQASYKADEAYQADQREKNRIRSAAQYEPVAHLRKPCAFCGALFEPTRKDALYCKDRTCRNRRTAAQAIERDPDYNRKRHARYRRKELADVRVVGLPFDCAWCTTHQTPGQSCAPHAYKFCPGGTCKRAWHAAGGLSEREAMSAKRERRQQQAIAKLYRSTTSELVFSCGYCQRCGAAFVAPPWQMPGDYCSSSCRTRSKGRSDRTRRDREAGFVITPRRRHEIYERDGWSCYICGEPTDPHAHHLSDWAPSVDHVIPLSRDGEHAMHNLRCAHRWCNIIKGTALITEAF